MASCAMSLALVGCRADLVQPIGRSGTATAPVQPWIRVVGIEGGEVARASVYVDPTIYRERSTAAERQSFTYRGSPTRLPEPTRIPFFLEVGLNGGPNWFGPDLAPGPNDTIVVDFSRPNFEVRLDIGDGPTPASLGTVRGSARLRFDRASSHVPDGPSGFVFRGTDMIASVAPGGSAERGPYRMFATVPPEVTGLDEVTVEWERWSTEELAGVVVRESVRDVPFDAGTVLEFRSEVRPMPLSVGYGAGRFELPLGSSIVRWRTDEVVRTVAVSTPTPGARNETWGYPGSIEIAFSRLGRAAVMLRECTVDWSGNGPLRFDIAPHRLGVRVVDAEGRPWAHTAIVAKPVVDSSERVEAETDADGRAEFYLEPGAIRLLLADWEYRSNAPAGGPWHMNGDRDVVWELER